MKKLLILTAMIVSLYANASNANTVTNWVNKTWNETVDYQKNAWQSGKEQNAKNMETIKSFFNKVKNNVSQN